MRTVSFIGRVSMIFPYNLYVSAQSTKALAYEQLGV